MTDYGFATATTNLSTGLTTNIPLVLTIFAGLTVLGISIHYVRKWLGHK